MVKMGDVRFAPKDLISFYPTSGGVVGARHIEGIFIALLLRNAPAMVKVGFETEEEREIALKRLDRIKRVKKS